MSDAELARRVEKLERENLRLKHYGLVVVALMTALMAIYAAQPVPGVIKAHEFDLVDASGRKRAKLGMVEDFPQLVMFDERGRNTLALFGEKVRLVTFKMPGHATTFTIGPRLILYGNGKFLNSVQLGAGEPGLKLIDNQASAEMKLNTSGEPSVRLSDSKGYSMTLGGVATVNPDTGQTRQSSAASIVMFNNDKQHHVIWQAP